jgi:ribonuclease HIII
MVVFVGVKKGKLAKLKDYSEEEPKTVYEEVRLKKGKVTLILYTSGKLLLQGNQQEVAKIALELEKIKIGKKEKSEEFWEENGWIIGSDESLKGDTFGGITVAAVKADEKIRKKLLEMGVADSKTLSDGEVLRLADKIRKVAACEVKSIYPQEYNDSPLTITHWLNKLHHECAEYLQPGKHVVDKFPGCQVGELQEEKAESKYLEVAAASILARDAALRQLNALSAQAGFHLPKGSTHVQLALVELKHRKLNFTQFVKINFWNVKDFLKE